MLGFTPTEIKKAQADPKFTVEQLSEIELCKEYVKTPLQTLDNIYVHQPKKFLLLAKEAKMLADFLKRSKKLHSGQESHQRNWFKKPLLNS